MISQKTIDEIKSKLTIADLIGENVSLKGRGNNFVGLCPFHSEKSPSFNVRPDEGYYHCFGCGASGNMFTYVMTTQNLSFPETIEYLANKLGIAIERTEVKDNRTDHRREVYQVNQLANNFFINTLKNNFKLVKNYFEQRSIPSETIKRYALGLATNEWRELSDTLRKQGISEALLLESGLAKRNQKGELYDTFRGRLVFPVYIDNQRIAGFGGRLIPGFSEQSDAPKYLNSAESPTYEKSKILYGLPQALASIRSKKSVYIVEGYLDVTSLSQSGVENVLACCGTALTKLHLQRLSSIVNKVLLLFDGDNAGRAAAAKSFASCINSGVDILVVFLPDGLDPDDFAKKHASNLTEALESLPRMTPLECYLNHQFSLNGAEKLSDLGAAAKAKLAADALALIEGVSNAIEQSELKKQLSFHLAIESQLLVPKVSNKVTPNPVKSTNVSVPRLSHIDRDLLRCVITAPLKYGELVLSDADLCATCSDACLQFISTLIDIYSLDSDELERKQHVINLLKSFGREWIELWRQAYSMQDDPLVDFEKVFLDCRMQARKNRLIKMIQSIEDQLAQGQAPEDLEQLYQKKLELNRKLSQS